MLRSPSVQARYVNMAGFGDHWVAFADGQRCAALEVDGLAFGLLSDEEQELVVAGYAAFLQGLEQPVQLLVRVLPMDLQGRLANLEERAPLLPDALVPFARDEALLLRALAAKRSLLERHHYLVISTAGTAIPARWPWPWRRSAAADTDAAPAALAARLDALVVGLRRAGLDARRLSGRELVLLLHACWCPDLSRRQRLADDLDAMALAPGVSRPERMHS